MKTTKQTVAGVPLGRWVEWEWKDNEWRHAKISSVKGDYARVCIRLSPRHLINRILRVTEVEAHLAARPGNDRRRTGT